MPKPARISKGDGDGRRWTTKEQTAWLEAQISAYISAQAGPQRNLSVFWIKLYQDWFTCWPEAASPSSLDPQANATEGQEAAKEDEEAVRVTKLVCTYAALSVQS